jgi:hypothetical protein
MFYLMAADPLCRPDWFSLTDSPVLVSEAQTSSALSGA